LNIRKFCNMNWLSSFKLFSDSTKSQRLWRLYLFVFRMDSELAFGASSRYCTWIRREVPESYSTVHHKWYSPQQPNISTLQSWKSNSSLANPPPPLMLLPSSFGNPSRQAVQPESFSAFEGAGLGCGVRLTTCRGRPTHLF